MADEEKIRELQQRMAAGEYGKEFNQELLDVSIDLMAEYAEPWQGDKADDRIARALIAPVIPLLEALASIDEDDQPNALLFGLAMRSVIANIQTTQVLRAIAAMKGD